MLKEKDGIVYTAIPPALQDIIEAFQSCENQKKLALLLAYAEAMPPLPDWIRDQNVVTEQIQAGGTECGTPLQMHAGAQDGRIRFFFTVPADAPTIRGYASILCQGLDGATPDQVLNVPGTFYEDMGLQKVLTPQRLHEFSTLLTHMKRFADKEHQQMQSQ